MDILGFPCPSPLERKRQCRLSRLPASSNALGRWRPIARAHGRPDRSAPGGRGDKSGPVSRLPRWRARDQAWSLSSSDTTCHSAVSRLGVRFTPPAFRLCAGRRAYGHDLPIASTARARGHTDRTKPVRPLWPFPKLLSPPPNDQAGREPQPASGR